MKILAAKQAPPFFAKETPSHQNRMVSWRHLTGIPKVKERDQTVDLPDDNNQVLMVSASQLN